MIFKLWTRQHCY